MAKFAGLPWDTVFGADLFHHYKPDHEVYLGAAELLSLKPSEVMMAAAHPRRSQSRASLRTESGLRPAAPGARPASSTAARRRATPPAASVNSFDVVATDFIDLAAKFRLNAASAAGVRRACCRRFAARLASPSTEGSFTAEALERRSKLRLEERRQAAALHNHVA